MSSPVLRVLLIEDDPDDVWLIRDALSGRMQGRFELTHFDRLAPAAAHLADHPVDVALLDLTLPDSSGLATFEQLHQAAPELPIIVLTGFDDESQALAAVQAGAQDYLIKAQVDANLVARSVLYAVERSRRAETERSLRASEAKLRVAREIQQRLFPAQSPTLPGYDLGGATFPADATGGDYFDYIPMLADAWGLVVGDVSGHGVGAAFIMTETRACLRSMALTFAQPDEILVRTNRILTADTADFHFVTLFLARLDPVDRQLTYSSAGHTGFLLEPSGAVVPLDSTALPLGIDAAAQFPPRPPRTLLPGQLVLLVTDGLLEARDAQGDLFGAERLCPLVHSWRELPAAEIVHKACQAARDFSGGRHAADDMTAVVLKVLC